jgi:serine/threonine protein kinase
VAYTFKHGDRPLDDFTIQRAVGRGGFGEVYYAVSDGGREVALKYLRDNPQVELRGVAHCMNLKSPHLVTIFDVKKSAADEYFIVMEYVGGPSLRDLLIAEPNGVGVQKAAFFMREIAKGLGYLHDRGIVHRDLKPGNIFYDEGYVKIGDYGLSKAISVSRHSAQTASVGTVHYMAPEVGSGNYHRGIDLYALGVMLYEMLLGKVPFEGSTMGEVLMKHLTMQPEVDKLPAPFGKIIRKALEKDPKERYQNVYEMVDDLLAVEDVQASLAGFNPISLSQAARYPVGDPPGTRSPSPAPSPNPPPRGVPRPRQLPLDEVLDVRELPQRIAKKLSERGKQVEKRVRKLDSKYGRPARPADEPERSPVAAIARLARNRPEAVKRLALAAIVIAALGIGVGIVNRARPETIFGGIGVVGGISVGIAIGCRLMCSFMKSHVQPRWVERVTLAAPVGVITGIGILPMMDAFGSEERTFAAWGAIMVATFLMNWRRVVAAGSLGELSLKAGVKSGFIAGIIGMIFADRLGGHEQDIGYFVGASAFAATLAVQALAWLFPLHEWLEGREVRPGDSEPPLHGAGAPAPLNPNPADMATVAQRRPIFDAETTPYAPRAPREQAQPPAEAVEARRLPSHGDTSFLMREGLARRWMITRMLGGLIGFASLVGLVVAVARTVEIGTGPIGWHYSAFHVAQGAAASGALLGLMFFGFRKASRYRSGGFLRDTFRPLLFAGISSALGYLIAADVLRAHEAPPPDVRRILVVVLSIVWFVLLLPSWRRDRRKAHSRAMQVETPLAEEPFTTAHP